MLFWGENFYGVNDDQLISSMALVLTSVTAVVLGLNIISKLMSQ